MRGGLSTTFFSGQFWYHQESFEIVWTALKPFSTIGTDSRAKKGVPVFFCKNTFTFCGSVHALCSCAHKVREVKFLSLLSSLSNWVQSQVGWASSNTLKWFLFNKSCSSRTRSSWTWSTRWGASEEERFAWGRAWSATGRTKMSRTWGRRLWSSTTSKVCSKPRVQCHPKPFTSTQTTRLEASCCNRKEIKFPAQLVTSIWAPESFLRNTLKPTIWAELNSMDLLIKKEFQKQILSQIQKIWTYNKQTSMLRRVEWQNKTATETWWGMLVFTDVGELIHGANKLLWPICHPSCDPIVMPN